MKTTLEDYKKHLDKTNLTILMKEINILIISKYIDYLISKGIKNTKDITNKHRDNFFYENLTIPYDETYVNIIYDYMDTLKFG